MTGRGGKKGGVERQTQKITDALRVATRSQKPAVSPKGTVNSEENSHNLPNTCSSSKQDTPGMVEVINKLEKLTDMVLDLRKESIMVKEVLEQVNAVKDKMRMETTLWEVEKQALKNRIELLEKREDYRDRQERKNNVIIRGLELNQRNALENVKQFLVEKLGVETAVEEAVVMGKETKMVLVKLSNAETKRQIMEQKKKLYGSKVFVGHDRSVHEREIQRKIWKIAEEEKEKGNTVKIGFKKLEVNEHLFTWREGDGLVETFRQNSQRRNSDYSPRGSRDNQQQRNTTRNIEDRRNSMYSRNIKGGKEALSYAGCIQGPQRSEWVSGEQENGRSQ